MTTFRIDKRRVAARFLLTDGTMQDGLMFLARHAASHAGEQTVPDLMAEPGHLFPCRDTDGGFMMIGKDGLSAVVVVPTAGDVQGFWHSEPVDLVLTGGHHIGGSLLVEDGAGNRMSDVLNASGRWIRLHNADRLAWIRKSHVVIARPSR